jgi:hypothetical protein
MTLLMGQLQGPSDVDNMQVNCYFEFLYQTPSDVSFIMTTCQLRPLRCHRRLSLFVLLFTRPQMQMTMGMNAQAPQDMSKVGAVEAVNSHSDA